MQSSLPITKGIWIRYFNKQIKQSSDYFIGKSFKITSDFLKDIIQKLIIELKDKNKMMYKFGILEKKEKQSVKRTYGLIQKGFNSELGKLINLHPNYFDVFYRKNQSFIRARNTIPLGANFVEIRFKIFGIYFSNFHLKLGDSKGCRPHQNSLKRVDNQKTSQEILPQQSRKKVKIEKSQTIRETDSKVKNSQKSIFSNFNDSFNFELKHIKEDFSFFDQILDQKKSKQKSKSKEQALKVYKMLQPKNQLRINDIFPRSGKNSEVKQNPKKSKEKNSMCAICLEALHKERGILDCNHEYCRDCIQEWIKKSSRCPMCKIESKLLRIFLGRIFLKSKFLEKKELTYTEEPNELDIIVANADPFCYKCNSSGNENFMLICDSCDKKCCHIICLDPPMHFIPEDDWFCDFCVREFQLEYKNPIANIFQPKRVKRKYKKRRQEEHRDSIQDFIVNEQSESEPSSDSNFEQSQDQHEFSSYRRSNRIKTRKKIKDRLPSNSRRNKKLKRRSKSRESYIDSLENEEKWDFTNKRRRKWVECQDSSIEWSNKQQKRRKSHLKRNNRTRKS